MKLDLLTRDNVLVLDGAMGTMLLSMGYDVPPETLNATHPEVVEEIHRAYYRAGSQVVCANTFGINPLRYGDQTAPMLREAIAIAQRARAPFADRYVALDIGPLGRLLHPLGDFDFEEAVQAFATVVRVGVQCGVDLIIIETLNDGYETKAALLAAKENSDLPVLVSNAYGEDGKLLTGATPETMVALAEALGADAVGANCSFGPSALSDVVRQMVQCASIPVMFKPNAGLPTAQGYDTTAADFAAQVADAVGQGVRIVGGCCGTTPQYIEQLVRALPPNVPPVCAHRRAVATSYANALYFSRTVLVGERLNPTGKKALQQALIAGDYDFVATEGLRQQQVGAQALDVNVSMPGLDEKQAMLGALDALAAVVDVPLQFDSGNPQVLEAAMRRYNGKPIINSVNGSVSSMQSVFPLVAHYGGVVVALLMDEKGIPPTAQGRLAIAQRIVDAAAQYGVPSCDLLFDPLCLAVSADSNAGRVTLQTLGALHDKGYNTILGLSNVSFGLPNRDILNATMLSMALCRGLTAAIVNPFSAPVMATYYAFCALDGQDKGCSRYLTHVGGFSAPETAVCTDSVDLRGAIVGGLKDSAARLAKSLSAQHTPIEIINAFLVPALDEIGRRYEAKQAYLPQLLMAAEAAKSAFDAIKTQADGPTKCPFVLATVQGDIHDIGKNIVGLLLQNYGFRVIDLGKDVAPQTVVDAVRAHNAPLVGLSSLMTTTLGAMRQTVALLHAHTSAKVVVGGAVLTPQYAAEMGADCYAKDAMETVRYAEAVYKGL